VFTGGGLRAKAWLAAAGCLTTLGTLAIPSNASAETLIEAYKLARQSDPKFRAAQYESKANATAYDQAVAGLLPTIRFESTNVGTRQAILSSNNPIFGPGVSTFPTDTWTLSLSQPLFRMDLIERYKQTKAIVRQAQYTVLAAEQDLMLRTTTAYLTVLAAEDGLALAKAERATVARGQELARERLKMGLGTITNLHDASARFAVTQAREIESENKLSDARQALKEITGRAISNYQALRPEFKPVLPEPRELDRWVQTAHEQNLLLKARDEAVEVARQEVERQRAGHFPSLNVVAARNRNDAGSTLFGGGSNVETNTVTLQLSGLVLAVTEEAANRYQKTQEEREQERRSVERQTRAAFQGAISGQSLVEALTQSVISQQSALEGKEVGFKSGVFPLLPVLDAQRDLFIARRDYSQSRYDYLVNSLKLKQAAGTLSESDLEAINAALQ
jgi:outer membrane protein